MALAWVGALWLGPTDATAQAGACAQALPTACLQRFGAGVVASEPNGALDCAGMLEAYRDCIAGMVQEAPVRPAAAPLSRAERGFLEALEAELADNVGRLESFVDGLDETGARPIYEVDWPALRLRFFDATDNPAYFAAPAKWLADTQGFYDELARELAREDVREVYRSGNGSMTFDRKLAKQRLSALVALGRDRLLPEISAALALDGR